jgi:tripeptidyl-peptidase-1
MSRSQDATCLSTLSARFLKVIVSDPSNARYGQYLTKDEVEELIKPTAESFSAVQDWLLSNGIEIYQTSTAKDWIYLNVSIGSAEMLLNSNYHIYQNSKTGSYEIRSPTWSLPQALHEHIAMIHPTNYFPTRPQITVPVKSVSPPKPMAVSNSPSVPSGCQLELVTPECLRKLYKTINYEPQAAGQNKVAITNWLNQTTIIADVQTFLKQNRPEYANFDFEIISINNGSTSQSETDVGNIVEANLDAQMVTGSSVPTPLTIFATGGVAPVINGGADNEPYLVFLQYILGKENDQIPSAIDFSYEDQERTVPFSYAQAVCRGFAQLGVRGVSTFFSSGDGSSCLTKGKVAGALFPSSCPYVTSVGGTFQFDPEIAANSNGFITGGGFSNYFAMPDYQKETIQSYIDSIPEDLRDRFNSSGRAYPDVSAQSVNLSTIILGQVKYASQATFNPPPG